MDIAVVIPVFNRAGSIEATINSVLQQTCPASEIIVVDDCSTDSTAAVLKKYTPRITIVTNETNQGVSYSRNRGIEAAGADWIAFLDSDDTWDKHKLEAQKHFHEINPDLSISQCDEIWIRNGVRVNPMAKHAKQGGWIFKACIPRCIVSPSAVIIHKNVFDKIGHFDPQLPACEDYDLWLRIAPHYEIGYLDEKLMTRYGGHADQLSQKYWGMDRFRITAMEKQVECDLKAPWRKALLEELVLKCGIVADGAHKRGKSELSKEYLEKRKQHQQLLSSEFA